ncbi:hypothetical protein G6F35_016977 [Rhizopus arrhizus]|nr:hypothetical protein G6F35_016977 [Rhizopus arrhizus]
MLDMAKVTPQDRLMDLGSGDGRTVITAAQRGLTAQGIEYNPDLVELSRRNAQRAGVADRATFVAADLFQTDLSKADVITMFLLSTINEKLRPTLLQLPPGTRVVIARLIALRCSGSCRPRSRANGWWTARRCS